MCSYFLEILMTNAVRQFTLFSNSYAFQTHGLRVSYVKLYAIGFCCITFKMVKSYPEDLYVVDLTFAAAIVLHVYLNFSPIESGDNSV